MKRHLLILTAIVCLVSVGSEAEDSGYQSYTIKNTETLYQACKAAVEEYKDKPQEIGNSTCGAYIQGFIGGFAASAINIYSQMPDEGRKFFHTKEIKKYTCVGFSASPNQVIADFVAWREKYPEFNDAPYSALLGSILESEKCTNIGKEKQ